MKRPSSRVPSRPQVWGGPIAYGVASLAGLLSALLADGIWDGVSWLALGAVCWACLWHGAIAGRRRKRGRPERAVQRPGV